MVEIRFDKKFANIFSKLDGFMKKKVINHIKKISENPEIGKPMKHDRKGTRELYIKPFRLSYECIKNKNIVYILDPYHKKNQ